MEKKTIGTIQIILGCLVILIAIYFFWVHNPLNKFVMYSNFFQQTASQYNLTDSGATFVIVDQHALMLTEMIFYMFVLQAATLLVLGLMLILQGIAHRK